MFETKLVETTLKRSLLKVRCIEDEGSHNPAGWWLPLKQDWLQRWVTVPERFMDGWVHRVAEFETRESDVFVVSLMKTGSTWMQEQAWLILNDLDFKTANGEYSMNRSPYLEFSSLAKAPTDDSIKVVHELPSPRLIKSHLPVQLLPHQVWLEGRKVIYVARNPKDVLVSTYHFLTKNSDWQCDLDTFVNEFTNDVVLFNSYWSHVIDFWRLREEPNVFFVTFEDMKRDLSGVIDRLCKFLGKKQLQETEMEQLVGHLSFDNMKTGKFSNLSGFFVEIGFPAKFEFMRRGIVGSYKDELTADQIEKVNKWTSDNLKPYGIRESDIFGEI